MYFIKIIECVASSHLNVLQADQELKICSKKRNLSIHESHDHDVPHKGGAEEASDDDILPLPASNLSQVGQHLVLTCRAHHQH